ncbi:MAG TPA: aminotransferase class IV [Galbitalea sp.]|jgi:branched-subunit amino acid aminotransferase/4-amino-4-deoxychorismate lyase
MSTESIYRWQGRELVALDYCDMTDTVLDVADSWLVDDGTALAFALHRERFLSSMDTEVRESSAADAFWEAAVALIPREGTWFPRVELQRRGDGRLLVFRQRSAPTRTNNLVETTWRGLDPRTVPRVKGPDLEAMTRVRTAAQAEGASEAIILNDDGFVVEDAHSGLLWWRGDILCGPPTEFPRVDSVTVRSLLALASALGVETYEEAVTPAELDGTELWSLNALHGIRIVTEWVGGPGLAQLPGRLAIWRARMDALRRPI